MRWRSSAVWAVHSEGLMNAQFPTQIGLNVISEPVWEKYTRIKWIKWGSRVSAPAAMAPTSGTRHVWTGLHQVPMMNTTPRGSLTTRHSSNVVDCTNQTSSNKLGYSETQLLWVEVSRVHQCMGWLTERKTHQPTWFLQKGQGNVSFNLLWQHNTFLCGSETECSL